MVIHKYIGIDFGDIAIVQTNVIVRFKYFIAVYAYTGASDVNQEARLVPKPKAFHATDDRNK
jgi:hypothetical protein